MPDEFEQLTPTPGGRVAKAVPGDPGFSYGSDMQPDDEKYEYRNKTVINQRGATVEINNSTDREELKLSQYSGSNIALTNSVNSELATNNKQVKVNNDSFESVGSDKNVYVGKDKVERVSENTYILRGFANGSQLANFTEWKRQYKSIADNNSQFRMLRGGFSFPNGLLTLRAPQPPDPDLDPDHWHQGRSNNPTINPVDANRKRVLNFDPVTGKAEVKLIAPTAEEVVNGSGGKADQFFARGINAAPGGFAQGADVQWSTDNEFGSAAHGVIQYGGEWSSSTEGGRWKPNPIFIPSVLVGGVNLTQQEKDIIDQQNILNDYEIGMGNGGDEITFVKRHKIETIGAVTNDYPSTRIDPEGRSQPLGIDVGENTSYENMDYISHVEEVDNDMAIPAGNYTLNVGNRYNVLVGSGGLQLKTSGSVEMGGAVTKIAGAQVTIQASSQPVGQSADDTPPGGGTVHIGSDGAVAIQAQKSVSLRSNRQVLVSPSLGVKRNLKVGGGAYVEGELYVHHITAPMIKKSVTSAGVLYGKFNTDCPRTLEVAEAALDIRKLVEQIKWVEEDNARRQAAIDAAAKPLIQRQEEAAKEFFDDFGQEGELFEARGFNFWRDAAAAAAGAVVNDDGNWDDWEPAIPDPAPEEDYICWYPVYALPDDDIIKTRPHTHQYTGLPIRGMATNADVRKIAMCEYINRDDRISHAREAKDEAPAHATGPISAGGIREGCTTSYPTTQPPEPPQPETCVEVPDCSCETTEPPENGSQYTDLETEERAAFAREDEKREDEQKAIDNFVAGGPDGAAIDDFLQDIQNNRKARACERACDGKNMHEAQIAEFGDIVAAIQARDRKDGLGNDVGDGGAALDDLCGCGGGNGGNGGGNDDGGNAVVPENLVAVPPGTPGNGDHVNQLLQYLAGGEFEDMGLPGPNGAPGLQPPPPEPDFGNFNDPAWRGGMDALREFWDGINVQRKADVEPLILFPAIPDPRNGIPAFADEPDQPAIPAGVWGPESPNNPANL